MSHIVAFHQGLHYWLRQKRFYFHGRQYLKVYVETICCDHLKFNVSRGPSIYNELYINVSLEEHNDVIYMYIDQCRYVLVVPFVVYGSTSSYDELFGLLNATSLQFEYNITMNLHKNISTDLFYFILL